MSDMYLDFVRRIDEPFSAPRPRELHARRLESTYDALLAMQRRADAESGGMPLAPTHVRPDIVARCCVASGYDPELDSPDGLHWPHPVKIEEAAEALVRWIEEHEEHCWPPNNA